MPEVSGGILFALITGVAFLPHMHNNTLLFIFGIFSISVGLLVVISHTTMRIIRRLARQRYEH